MNKKIEDFRAILNDPDSYIYEYFNKIKNDLQLRKEETLEQIKSYFEEEIEKLEKFRAESMSSNKERAEFMQEFKRFDIEALQAELKAYEAQQSSNAFGIICF